MTNENQCGQCYHFHRLPRASVDLSQPVQGECLEGPPGQVAVPVQTGMGQAALQWVVRYPVVPENFRSCHRFAPVVKLAMELVPDGNE